MRFLHRPAFGSKDEEDDDDDANDDNYSSTDSCKHYNNYDKILFNDETASLNLYLLDCHL